MELIRALPQGRTKEQLENHYLVEKALADQLKAADRSGRKRIYETMYDQLFEKVPDHPRLADRDSARTSERFARVKYGIVKRFLSPDILFMEVAAGDCFFARKTAEKVKQVIALDISDQRKPSTHDPDNFTLIVYDGYDLDTIPDNSVDVAFSDQFVEHLHPEDTLTHFRLVNRLLKSGGKYVFRTPHRYAGPHDVSMFFSNEAQGFHLKEWTYGDFKELFKVSGFKSFQAMYVVGEHQIRLPVSYFLACEALLKHLPRKLMRRAAYYLIHSICIVAEK